jgi:PAS domain S-box-containing protein
MKAPLHILRLTESTSSAEWLASGLAALERPFELRSVDVSAAVVGGPDREDWDVLLVDDAHRALPVGVELAWRPMVVIVPRGASTSPARALSILREGAWDVVEEGDETRLALAVERAAAEAERRRVHERDPITPYRVLFDQAVDGIMLLSLDGAILRVNAAFARMHGYESPEAMAGVRLADLDTPVSAPFARERVRRTLAGEHLSFEVEHFRKDGSRFPLSVTASRVELGGRPYVLVFHRDVSAQKASEVREKEQAARLDFALDAAEMVSWELDVARGTIEFASAVPQLAGLFESGVRLTLEAVQHRVHPDDRARVREAAMRTILAGARYDCEYRVRALEPERDAWIWIAARGGAVRDALGQVTRVVGVSQNVTARKASEAALEASEARFRNLFEHAHDALFVMDTSTGRFVSANPAAVAMFGARSTEDLVARPPWDFSPPEQPSGGDSSSLAKERIVAAAREGFQRFEWTHQRLDGARFLADVQYVALEHDARALIFATVRDIDERRRSELALQDRERLLSLAMEVGGIGVFEIELPSGRATWSPLVAWLWGVPEGFDGDFSAWCWARVHPDDVASARAVFERVLAEPDVQDGEFRVVRPDGTVRWLRWRGRTIRDEAGAVVRVTGVNQDVTERRRLELEREEALIKYRTLFDALPVGVTIADCEGRILESNAVADRILGLSREEQRGRNVGGDDWPIVRPDGSPMPPAEYASVRALSEQRVVANVEMAWCDRAARSSGSTSPPRRCRSPRSASPSLTAT